jgi:hypothetical protein
MVEEIIGQLPELTGAQLGRLEDEIRRERQRRASSAGGEQDAPRVQEDAAPPVTYRAHGGHSPSFLGVQDELLFPRHFCH